ncbi:MAG: immunity 51 family protein [Lachnospiraceae bacterium]|nr:immunity 51 family protein [Lachnospiraceae bacterium]
MKDYYNISFFEDYISVSLYVEYEEVMKLGEAMEQADSNAYMNGYNWEAFLNKYLEYNAPEILDILESDSEAGMYSAYINDVNEETKALAQKFGEIIESLIENEDLALDFLEEHGDEIDWD